MTETKKCLHCEQSFISKNDNFFCCNGCHTAYNIIKDSGLDKYYRERKLDKTSRPLVPVDHSNINFNDFIKSNSQNESEINLMVEGIHCAACVWVIENILNNSNEIINARLNMTTKRLYIIWKSNDINIETIIKKISDIGYRLAPYDPKTIATEDKKNERELLIAMAVAGFACTNVMLFSIAVWSGSDMGDATKKMMHLISALIAIPALIYSGQIFFKSALKSIKTKSYNMDIPISVALIITTIISVVSSINNTSEVYFESVTMLMFFLLVGRYLEHMTRKRASVNAENLLLLEHKTSLEINENGIIKAIPINKIKQNTILLISSGETIPADSELLEIEARIDSSVITGESIPKKIHKNQEIPSGSINCGNPIKVKVLKIPSDSTLAQIASLIDNQPKSKNKYVILSQKLTKLYVPIVHLLAFATVLIWGLSGDWYSGIINASAVLIVTCPCALALAIPVVHTLCTSALLKKSIILKNPDAFDHLLKANDIIFDKTGTLTTGKLSISNEIEENDLKIASQIASHSNHPIAKALIGDYINTQLDVTEVIGKGLIAKINGTTYKLGSADFCEIENKTDKITAYLKNETTGKITNIEFSDTLKCNVKETILNIRKLRITPHILSGDSHEVVKKLAELLDIDQFKSDATPIEKMDYVANIKSNNRISIMVGDGINDAPTLQSSDVAISFSGANAMTQNTADIIINNNNLLSITDCINLSIRASRIIKQNILISIFYNAIAIPLAVCGLISPLLAAILMSVSSITVILNSLRVLK